MAAYAALVSLRHIIEQIQHHPRPPISLHKLQVESLTEKVTFLQNFLESYCINGDSEDEDGLKSRIADLAYAAEDIIESHIVDQILSQSTSQRKKIGFLSFFRGLWTAIRHGENMGLYQGLQKVIQEMDFINKDVMLITEKMGSQDQLLHRSSISAGALRPHSTGQNMTMVGFDDVLIEIMDKLTGQQSNRQIIPIVGMGGIGLQVRVVHSTNNKAVKSLESPNFWLIFALKNLCSGNLEICRGGLTEDSQECWREAGIHKIIDSCSQKVESFSNCCLCCWVN